MLRSVLVTNDSSVSEFHYTAEHLSCNIGTARVITDVFSELLFEPVCIREARFYHHSRNGESPCRDGRRQQLAQSLYWLIDDWGRVH